MASSRDELGNACRVEASFGETKCCSQARATSTSRAPEVVKTRRNPFVAIIDFFRGVLNELSKVIWPTARELVTYTLIVLIFLILVTALVAGVDWVTTLGVRAAFGL